MKKCILFTFTFAVLALLFVYTPVSHAESGQTYEVDGSSVNVRTEAASNAEVVGTLNSGDQIEVFQESFGWYQTYYEDQTAWVSSQFLTSVSKKKRDNGKPDNEDEETASSEKITVQNDARIRTGPGTNHMISSSTTKDDTYSLVETKDNWHQVELDDGQTGWIASWLTDTSNDQKDTDEEDSNNEKQTASNTTGDGDLSGRTIVLDPGHGGKDPGSIALDGTFEKEYTLETADQISQKLQNSGANVIQTRTDDTFISLSDRVSNSAANEADAFISLHYNAYPTNDVNGFSTHYYAPADNELAQEVQSGLTRNITFDSRGSMQSNYHVLRENSQPAVLLELGFITNTNNLSNIQTNDYQNAVGKGIEEGLLEYFN